ncbi:MAG: MmgE/PrpD family protein [Xanthobacteraceae bacterium]
MSHAEALHPRHPAAGATDAIVTFVSRLGHSALSDEVRHYARRHLLDTVGVMISGAGGNVATQAEAMLMAARAPGDVPVPGRARRADLIDAAFLGGTAAHGIELDDGYTKGSVHPGCAVVPAVLAAGYVKRASGTALIEAIVAGYETVTAIGRAVHPDLRHRGFHPTGAVSVFGAAMATGKLRGLSPRQLSNALGIAASSSAGLFAFVNGGADIKRLHAGHAAREGLQAALLAECGLEGPPAVIEARDGFMQAFAFERPDKARPVELPPAVPFGITDCYIKPNPCCRHIQPAVEALIGILNDEKVATEDVKHVKVETYRIAAEHAGTGWDDFAGAQLSFRYLMSLALKFRGIKVDYFDDTVRNDPGWPALAAKFDISAPHEIDRLYPKLRPARVTVTTTRGSFTRQADEALGSRLVPLDDDGLKAKFLGLVEPVLSGDTAREAARQLWDIDRLANVAPLVEALAK